MKAISFLGTGDYKNSSYQFPDGNIIHTLYFPFAVNEYYNPDEHFILMTKDAKEKHSEKMSELFKFHEVEIPFGKDEDQFWEIFDDIAECIEENDEVILDFTYGFRSQPVLAISALIYLKELKNIKIKNVIYGAFEAKINDVVPVFDMVSFVELIDWSYAVRDFLRYGKSAEINKLLQEIQIWTYKNDSAEKAKGLISAGNSLINLSQAMSIVNTKEIFEFSHAFSKYSYKLINDLIYIKKIKPIGLILNEIVERIEPVSSAEKNIFNEKGVKAQLSIIQWYIETEQYQQAITLMNELFISIQCIKYNLNPMELANRNRISHLFGVEIQKLKNKSQDIKSKITSEIWNKLSEIRKEINDVVKIESVADFNAQTENVKNLMDEMLISIKCIKSSLNPTEPENRIRINMEHEEENQKLLNINPEINPYSESEIWNKLSEIRNEINHAGMREKERGARNQIESIKDLFGKLKEQYSEMKIFEQNAAEPE